MRTPEAIVGGRSSNGTVFRLTVIPTSCSRSSASLPRPLRASQVELEEMRVGAPGEHVETARDQLLGDRVGVGAHLPLVLAERLRRGDLEARRLGRDHVLERAALQPGEDRSIDRLRVLLAAEHEARARAGERLVGRRGDDVAVLHRVRMETGRHEAREVRHVAPSATRPTSSAIRRNSRVSTMRG